MKIDKQQWAQNAKLAVKIIIGLMVTFSILFLLSLIVIGSMYYYYTYPTQYNEVWVNSLVILGKICLIVIGGLIIMGAIQLIKHQY